MNSHDTSRAGGRAAQEDARLAHSLRADGITKRYGAVTVLRDFTAELRSGEVLALMGANGAGKSTAGKILAGAVAASGGAVIADGANIPSGNRRAAIRAGLQFVPQELDLCEDLKVWENLAIADPRMRRWGLAVNAAAARQRSEVLLSRVGAAGISPEDRVHTLTFAQRQLVAIARALASDPKYVVFDEPTASLGQEEAEQVTSLVRKLAKEGLGCAFISHRIPEVLLTCDRVIVLRDGAIVDSGPSADYDEDSLEHAMFGSYATEIEETRASARKPEPALQIRGARLRPVFSEIDLDVAVGEIVGIYGLAGSGAGSLLRCVAGVHRLDGGSVVLREDGSEHVITSLRSARSAGVSFVSMDRGGEGIFAGHSTAINVEAERLGSGDWTVTAKKATRAAVTVGATAGLGDGGQIYGRDADALSGGQQQKTLIARRMAGGSRIWILDEPLGGIDIKTKRDLAALFHKRVAVGDSVLVSTGDLGDLSALCDRAVVMRGGRIAGVVDAVDSDGAVRWTSDRLGQLSTLAVR